MARLNITKMLVIGMLGLCTGSQTLAEGPAAGVVNNPIRNSSVVGRTYCGVTNTLTNLPIPGFEITSAISRRKTTFLEGGVFTVEFLSANSNTYHSDGSVVSTIGAGSDGMGSYTQTGTKLDMVLSSGLLATWYVSNDGSTIHGTRSQNFVAGNGQQVARTITWTLVENDVCDGEL